MTLGFAAFEVFNPRLMRRRDGGEAANVLPVLLQLLRMELGGRPQFLSGRREFLRSRVKRFGGFQEEFQTFVCSHSFAVLFLV